MTSENEDPDGPYLNWLAEWAKTHSDGCTHVSQIHQHCCWQHDFAYQTGASPRAFFNGDWVPMSRKEADAEFLHCNQAEDVLGRFSPLAWGRWIGIRIFGRFFYKAKP